MWGPGGRRWGLQVGRGLGHFDGGKSQSCCPPPTKPARGSHSSPICRPSGHIRSPRGCLRRLDPHSSEAGLQPGQVPCPHPLAFSPAPRAVWTLLPPRGPRKAKPSNTDAWSSLDVGPGGLAHGGGRWEGSGDRETPKIQPHRKVHPKDAVPWEELTRLALVCKAPPSLLSVHQLAGTGLAIPLSS